jgi:hypothetical protein
VKTAALFLLFCLSGATVTFAYTLTLQAEDYIASHNAGGADFYVTSCSEASNGLAVEGYDYPGDWIELKLVISQAEGYVDSLRSAADYEAEAVHELTIFGPGGVPLAEHSTYNTYGRGIG